jgi:hypothetical protein
VDGYPAHGRIHHDPRHSFKRLERSIGFRRARAARKGVKADFRFGCFFVRTAVTSHLWLSRKSKGSAGRRRKIPPAEF